MKNPDHFSSQLFLRNDIQRCEIITMSVLSVFMGISGVAGVGSACELVCQGKLVVMG